MLIAVACNAFKDDLSMLSSLPPRSSGFSNQAKIEVRQILTNADRPSADTVKGSDTTLTASVGMLAGSCKGNITALQPAYNNFVRDKLRVRQQTIASFYCHPGIIDALLLGCISRYIYEVEESYCL